MQGHHVRARRNDNDKKCSYCDRVFTKEEHLKRHERTHTGEKPFKCHKCYRKYGRSDVLARHLQSHSLQDQPNNGQHAPAPERSSVESSKSSKPRSRSGGQPAQNSVNQSNITFLLSPSQEQSFAQPHVNTTSTPQNLHVSSHPVLSGSVNNPMTTVSLPQTQPQLGHGTTGLETPIELRPGTWDHLTHNDRNEHAQQDISISSLLPIVGPEIGAIAEDPNEGNGANAMAEESLGNNTSESLFSFRQISHGQQQMSLFDRGEQVQQHLSAQNRGLLMDIGPFETDPFQMEAEFDTYAYFGPGIIEGLDFVALGTPIPVHQDLTNKSQTFLSVEQTQQIRRLWRGRRSGPGVRLIWSLWFKVAHHGADNLFSKPLTIASASQRQGSLTDGSAISRWGMDEACRNGLIQFCKDLDDRLHTESLFENPSHNTPPGAQSDSASEGSVPGFAANGFPTREVLDTSLDFFFQYSPMQFVHKATFNARTTPCSLLLPMCLVGLTSLYPERSKPLILRYQKKLMQYCRDDLTSKSLEYGEAWELLISIASAFLVNYLALGHSAEVEECQAYTFCVQLLHITKSHGLFSAYLGDDLATQLQLVPTDESSWKVWARTESIKKLICYLILLDATCTRVMGSTGVLDINQVEVYLPCEDPVFEATTFPRFIQAVKRGTQLASPRLRLQDFQLTAPPSLNKLSMQTVLSCFCLQAAAARQALPGGGRTIFESSSCSPVEVFAKNPQSKIMVLSVISLPSKYAELFRCGDPLTMLAWNNLCLLFTADLDLLEIGSGREGSEPARRAMVAITKWSRSAGARRAILHASQIFLILSSSRLQVSNMARADRLLFVSALVLSMYLFVVERRDTEDTQVFELVQEINWTTIGGEGLQSSQEFNQPISPSISEQPADLVDTASDFIRHGGPVSFSGEDQLSGATAARKILLNFVYLLDDVGKWRESRYSQLLRIMSDLVIEGND